MALIDKVSETVRKGLKESTIQLLETTKEPRHAYICCEKTKIRRMMGMEHVKEVTTGLAFLNVEDQADQEYNLHDLVVNRGARVICYGNFPSANSPDNIRQDKYRVYSEPNALNPWDKMKSICDTYLGREIEVNELIEAEKQKVSLLTKELNELRSKQDARSTTTSTKDDDATTDEGEPRDARKSKESGVRKQ
jgi:hypothetical protein